MNYPKIQTIWKRDIPERGFVIIPGEYSRNEFENVKRWTCIEKIDGMNMQVIYRDDSMYYGPLLAFQGRTPKAEIPAELFSFMENTFRREIMENAFGRAREVTLFGEGYGAGIQKGGAYQEAKKFILFDVVIDGIWLRQSSVEDVADHFKIKSAPEIYGINSVSDAIEYVNSSPMSIVSARVKNMEGIVARSDPLMLFRNGNPLMWKLKLRDFELLEAKDEKEN